MGKWCQFGRIVADIGRIVRLLYNLLESRAVPGWVIVVTLVVGGVPVSVYFGEIAAIAYMVISVMVFPLLYRISRR